MITKAIYSESQRLNGSWEMTCIRPLVAGALWSHNDSQAYVDDSANWMIISIDSLLELEPALASIFDLPIIDIQLVADETGIYFVDNLTGQRIEG